MVTGASTADLAVILIDARKGVLTQTRRHSFLVSLLGIRHIVLAVNKLDLVDYSHERFEEIEDEYRAFAARDRPRRRRVHPDLGAARRQRRAPERADALVPRARRWSGTSRRSQIDDDLASRPFRMPVQWVNRPDLDFRGFSGAIVGGTLRPGDRVRVAAVGRRRRRSSASSPSTATSTRPWPASR